MAKRTYLFAWNPNNWPGETLWQGIEDFKKSGQFTHKWNCASQKYIEEGDRAFLIRIGKGKYVKGIFGSGYIVEPISFSGEYKGRPANQTTIKFDALLNPDTDFILNFDKINEFNSESKRKQNWTPQNSGISIHSELVKELETEWSKVANLNSIDSFLDAKSEHDKQHIEGASYEVTLTRYERNLDARNECIKYYGYSCEVCTINFKESYGAIGDGFIHVHHLNAISANKESYIINGKKDLVPVCPNCHAMLHKNNPPYTIEELKLIIKNK